jgi:hypothetical protein
VLMMHVVLRGGILECDNNGSGLVHCESKKRHNNRVLAHIVVLSLSLSLSRLRF